MSRGAKTLTISLPPKIYEEMVKVADEEGRTMSELAREAFRQYRVNRCWSQIRRWGAEAALKTGVTSEEDLDGSYVIGRRG